MLPPQVSSGWRRGRPELFPVFPAERQEVLGALERLHGRLVQREEWSHSEAVGTLRQTLQSPLFSHILSLQQSIRQLRNQVTNPDQLTYPLWVGLPEQLLFPASGALTSVNPGSWCSQSGLSMCPALPSASSWEPRPAGP